jgi:choline dehydrogenase-like flavoprotein
MTGFDPRKIYDAIVVGTGAAGGWATKELAERGMEILVLEAGPQLDPAKDFLTHAWPYEMKYRGFDRPGERERTYPKQWTADEYSKQLYITDAEHPYTTAEGKSFRWVRSRFVGGKILHWGREVRRLSDLDFRAAEHDGFGENWPIRYADLAPYYDKVESFVGVSGSVENIPHVPDGKYLPAMPLNCGEKIIRKAAPKVGMRLIVQRTAMRTRSINGLARCHYCGDCGRGCDVGAFWNSISDTLPAARKTGRMTLRPNSVAREILVDENGKARGVSFVDRATKKDYEVRSRAVVLGASALESTRILLNSVSRFWPNGMANSSGVLGHYLMDNFGYEHAMTALLPQLAGAKVTNEDGKSSGSFIVPYRNINDRHPRFIRSYLHETWSGARRFPGYALGLSGFGSEFKKQVRQNHPALVGFHHSFLGEMLSRWENYVEIDKDVKDAWGIPVLKIHCQFSDNEREMAADALENLKELLHTAGAEVLSYGEKLRPPGSMIHEMGTCRMGDDPNKSVLNKFNQAHEVSNLFVVDGSSFVTSAGYGPTLTIGALAARASDYLVDEYKRDNL